MEKSRPKIEKSFLRLNKIINIIILFVRLFYFRNIICDIRVIFIIVENEARFRFIKPKE